MDTDHFVGTITQKGIITHNSKILICRDVKDTLWEIPGGRVSVSDESPAEGLKREIKEELGIEISEPRAFFTCFSWHEHSQQKQYLAAYIAAATSETLTLSEEVGEARWVIPEEAVTFDLYPDIQKVMTAYLASLTTRS